MRPPPISRFVVVSVIVFGAATAAAEDAGSKRSAALAAALGLGFQPAGGGVATGPGTGLAGVARPAVTCRDREIERVRTVDAQSNRTVIIEKRQVCRRSTSGPDSRGNKFSSQSFYLARIDDEGVG